MLKMSFIFNLNRNKRSLMCNTRKETRKLVLKPVDHRQHYYVLGVLPHKEQNITYQVSMTPDRNVDT